MLIDGHSESLKDPEGESELFSPNISDIVGT